LATTFKVGLRQERSVTDETRLNSSCIAALVSFQSVQTKS